jgi:hypothetical protein
MAYQRYCYPCGKDVTCREQAREISEEHKTIISLFCPECDRRMGAIYE